MMQAQRCSRRFGTADFWKLDQAQEGADLIDLVHDAEGADGHALHNTAVSGPGRC